MSRKRKSPSASIGLTQGSAAGKPKEVARQTAKMLGMEVVEKEAAG